MSSIFNEIHRCFFFIKMAVRWSPVWESEFAVFKQDLRIYRYGEKVSGSITSTSNRGM